MLFAVQKFITSKAVREAARWFGESLRILEEEIEFVAKIERGDDVTTEAEALYFLLPKLFQTFIQKSPPKWPGQHKLLDDIGFPNGEPPPDIVDLLLETPAEFVHDFCITYYVNAFVRNCRAMTANGDPRGAAAINELKKIVDDELSKLGVQKFLLIVASHFDVTAGLTLEPLDKLSASTHDQSAAHPLPVTAAQMFFEMNEEYFGNEPLVMLQQRLEIEPENFKSSLHTLMVFLISICARELSSDTPSTPFTVFVDTTLEEYKRLSGVAYSSNFDWESDSSAYSNDFELPFKTGKSRLQTSFLELFFVPYSMKDWIVIGDLLDFTHSNFLRVLADFHRRFA